MYCNTDYFRKLLSYDISSPDPYRPFIVKVLIITDRVSELVYLRSLLNSQGLMGDELGAGQ